MPEFGANIALSYFNPTMPNFGANIALLYYNLTMPNFGVRQDERSSYKKVICSTSYIT